MQSSNEASLSKRNSFIQCHTRAGLISGTKQACTKQTQGGCGGGFVRVIGLDRSIGSTCTCTSLIDLGRLVHEQLA